MKLSKLSIENYNARYCWTAYYHNIYTKINDTSWCDSYMEPIILLIKDE